MSFSRDARNPPEPKYVQVRIVFFFLSLSRPHKASSYHLFSFSSLFKQDLIRHHKSGVVKLIEKGAVVYVCGDAKNMAKDVMKAFTESFQSVRHLSEQDAKERVLQLQKEKRYLQDIWA